LEEVGALPEATDQQFHADANSQVNDATEFAESAAYPSVDGFYDHVYATGPRSGQSP
jgi:TPP-dependent pyruvate/acetoin dehydrogenase alpha subunit